MFSKILYPIDVEPGDLSQAFLPRVVDMARQWNAELSLAYVLPGFGMPIVATFFPAGAEQKMVAKAKELLDEFCSRARTRRRSIHRLRRSWDAVRGDPARGVEARHEPHRHSGPRRRRARPLVHGSDRQQSGGARRLRGAGAARAGLLKHRSQLGRPRGA